MSGDATMDRVLAAVQLQLDGRKAEASDAMAGLWAEIGEDGDPLHRCTLAHYMADLQTDPHDSLLWNARSLTAAKMLTDERLQQTFPTLRVRGFMASLHLNLAQDHLDLGDLPAARKQLRAGEAATSALGTDGYAAMIRSGLARLAEKLTAQDGP